jgi:hypothetical protein
MIEHIFYISTYSGFFKQGILRVALSLKRDQCRDWFLMRVERNFGQLKGKPCQKISEDTQAPATQPDMPLAL